MTWTPESAREDRQPEEGQPGPQPVCPPDVQLWACHGELVDGKKVPEGQAGLAGDTKPMQAKGSGLFPL